MVKFIKTKIVLTTLIAGLFILNILLISDTYAQNGVEYTRLRYRPLIGGIQIEIWYQSSLWSLCTLGYVVKEVYSGRVGIITAGHCSYLYLSGDIYQPERDPNNYNYIEGPSYISQPQYDFMFIPYSDSAPKILFYNQYTGQAYQIYVNKVMWFSEVKYFTDRGAKLLTYKTGRTTGTTQGYIYYAEEYCPGYRYNYCLYAYLYSDKGDSGSPAYFWSYIEGVGDYVELYGHVVYINSTSSFTLIISPDVVLSGGYKPLTG